MKIEAITVWSDGETRVICDLRLLDDKPADTPAEEDETV